MRLCRFILPLVVLISSCDKIDVSPQKDLFLSEGILVANEGNFQWGNATLSIYDSEKETILNKVFQRVNGRPLGDVLQSITLNEDKAFLVLNNSGKVEVIDPNSFSWLNTISGFTSPRYFHIVNSEKAYVSDLYSNKIAVVDLNSCEISSYIACEGWTEEMVQVGDLVYLLNMEFNQICVIDTKQDAIVYRISVPTSVKSLKIDLQNRLWVCGSENGVGHLFSLDAETFDVVHSYTFVGENPTDLFVSGDGNNIYFLSNGLWHIDVSSVNVNSSPVIPADGRIFYGLSITEDKIYLADAINYVQNGLVRVHDKQYNFIEEWGVGMIPSKFYFIEP